MLNTSLRKKLLPKNTEKEFYDWLRNQISRLKVPRTAVAWDKRANQIRKQMLELFMRGHPKGILQQKPRVQWCGTLSGGNEYRIRKLRYEGYPGLWVPALLYEPKKLKAKVPVVLNPNGHHIGGKAMEYKQARCINLAKRGMLALNTEFIGMGELQADSDHFRISLLELAGVSGVGVFYLLMKRGLDVLLSHRFADKKRVAMTGLSGGGWQTTILSALDQRINCIVPVAGHSPVWQRIGCLKDIGDLEQVPTDLCTVADYDTLTALFAPRPSLLIYNRFDDCCFKSHKTRKSIYEPVKPVFKLFNVPNNVSFYDNVDPGTHNYESDNRRQLYKFLNAQWKLNTSDSDLPYEKEIYPESKLNTGIPNNNATLHSLALQYMESAAECRKKSNRKRTAAQSRKVLKQIIKLPSLKILHAKQKGKTNKQLSMAIRQFVIRLNQSMPIAVTECTPVKPKGSVIVLRLGGRRTMAGEVRKYINDGYRVYAADILGTGDARPDRLYEMVVHGTGHRWLGIQVAQIVALTDWVKKRNNESKIGLFAFNSVTSVPALAATALRPQNYFSLEIRNTMDSLERLIQRPAPYQNGPNLFCFGLLKEFDLPDLIKLCKGVQIHSSDRGPIS